MVWVNLLGGPFDEAVRQVPAGDLLRRELHFLLPISTRAGDVDEPLMPQIAVYRLAYGRTFRWVGCR